MIDEPGNKGEAEEGYTVAEGRESGEQQGDAEDGKIGGNAPGHQEN